MTVSKAKLESMEYVPNEPLRFHVRMAIRDGMTYGDIARAIGLVRISQGKPKADVSYLRKMLGEIPNKSGKRITWYQNIKYEYALGISRAIGVDPVDVGV